MIGVYNNLFYIKIKLFKSEWKISVFFRAESISDRVCRGSQERGHSAHKNQTINISASYIDYAATESATSPSRPPNHHPKNLNLPSFLGIRCKIKRLCNIALSTIEVLDASRRSRLQRGRRGATTEAYGAIRSKEEQSKATPLPRSRLGGEMMP
jgi:hypothetical protein